MVSKLDDAIFGENSTNSVRFSLPPALSLPMSPDRNGDQVNFGSELLISVASNAIDSHSDSIGPITPPSEYQEVLSTPDNDFSPLSPLSQSISESPASIGALKRLASNTARAINSIRRIFGKLVPDDRELKASQKRDEGVEGTEVGAHGEERKRVFAAPVFRLCPFFMTNTVCTDPVVFYNNAIRFETRSLFSILYCLQEREEEELHPGDIQSFFLWFEDYHNLFCTYVAVVNNVLVPSLRDLIPFGHLTPRYFADEGERLNRIVSKTITSSNRFMHMYEPPKAAAKLIEIYTEFAQPLLWFLFSIEKYCGVVIDRFGSAGDAQRISRLMASALRRMPFFRKILPQLLGWLHDRPQTKFVWLSSHYDYITVRLYRIWSRRSEHDRIIEYFELTSKTR